MIDNNKTISFSISVKLSEEEFQKLQALFRKPIEECMMAKKEKELLSVREACEYLSCSASSLYKWKGLNLIPYRKLGKRTYFNKIELTNALKEAGIFKKIQELK